MASATPQSMIANTSNAPTVPGLSPVVGLPQDQRSLGNLSLPGHNHPPNPDFSSTPSPHQTRESTELYTSFQHAPDGRIRNPVPSKLKGKADSRSGNFAVMHIEVARPVMSERDAAAKRISEGTAAAAKLASKNGYQAVKRTQLAWHPTQGDALSSSPSPHVKAHTAATAAAAPPPTNFIQPPELSAHDAKREQARLLTLLRSLNPTTVVDQLCKALAYFGGIPGAPPTDGTAFPDSVSGRGSGSRLVGWLAEIFPHVQGGLANGIAAPPGHPAAEPAPGLLGVDQATPIKRSRGRPKGSKSSKVRKDKGIKKSQPQPQPGTAAPAAPEAAPLQQDFPSSMDPAPASATPQHSLPADISSQFNPDASITSTPGGKKRGRPKGSKNKPKPQVEEQPEGTSSEATAQPQAPPPPQTQTQTQTQTPTHAQQQDSSSQQPTFGQAKTDLMGSIHQTQQDADKPTIQQQANGGVTPIPSSVQRASQTTLQHPQASPMGTQQMPGWLANGMQGTQPTQQMSEATPVQAARKRKNPQNKMDSNHSVDMAFDRALAEAAGHTPDLAGKRRRLSKDMSQNVGLASSQAVGSPLDLTASPAMGANPMGANSMGTNSIGQNPMSTNAMGQNSLGTSSIGQNPLSTNSIGSNSMGPSPMSTNFGVNGRPVSVHNGFDRQMAMNRQPVSLSPHQRMQQHQMPQQQGQHPQARHGQFSQQQGPAQASPGLEAATVSSSPASVQLNMSRVQGRSPYIDPQGRNTPQGFYAHQRHPSNQFTSMDATDNNNFAQALAQKSPQFAQHMARQTSGPAKNNNMLPGMEHQVNIASPRNQPPQARGHQTEFEARQTPPSSHPPPNMNHFQPYGNQNYLNMEYVMQGRNVNDPNGANNASYPGQLEAALQHSMRDRMF